MPSWEPLRTTSTLNGLTESDSSSEEYYPPDKEGFGARFIFLRYPEEKPFLDANTREVRFHAEYPSTLYKD